jgi:protein MpaA
VDVPLAERGRVRHAQTTVGESREGVPLHLYGPDASGTPLVIAALHGSEPETTVTLSAALRTLPPEELACAVVLAVNPDGLLRGTRGNAIGVDLNRNFPASDWVRRTVKHHWTSETGQVTDLSTGEGPASEPEARALIALVERLAPRWVLSVHAPIGMVLERAPTRLGAQLAARTGLRSARSVRYPVPGAFETWGHERGIPTTTLELPRLSTDEGKRVYAPLLAEVLRGGLA